MLKITEANRFAKALRRSEILGVTWTDLPDDVTDSRTHNGLQ